MGSKMFWFVQKVSLSIYIFLNYKLQIIPFISPETISMISVNDNGFILKGIKKCQVF